uniref:DUF1573 domain-containing protein n=1 Tax=Flavobacterium sp. TaxID=239 RepID=UPI00404A49D1
MRKTFFTLSIVAILFSGCKNDNALSKIDPNSTDVDMKAASMPAPKQEEAAKPAPPADGKYPKMTFKKVEHDFGTINEGDKVETVFEFTNSGEADLIISNAKGSCGCTVPEFPKEPIKPGETKKMTVTFNSQGKPNQQQKTVTIDCNTESGKETLTIKANVIPKAKTESAISNNGAN